VKVTNRNMIQLIKARSGFTEAEEGAATGIDEDF
jgi:hypothetical protein